ncbi:hypothetical protein AKJ16_DCAP02783 [Drosera capensis]
MVAPPCFILISNSVFSWYAAPLFCGLQEILVLLLEEQMESGEKPQLFPEDEVVVQMFDHEQRCNGDIFLNV